VKQPSAPRIYNLFPRLAGRFTAWGPHLERAARMGFNWVFLNPVNLTGFSGSLYSVKDYYAYDTPLVDPASGDTPEAQLKAALAAGRQKLGLRFMLDLVVNHTAIDSPLTRQHPDWYEREEDGSVRHPGALDGGRWVSWGDLAAVDNAHSPDRKRLWGYWDRLVAHYQGLGFEGFRCDAAYQVPRGLWRYVIPRARARGEALFFAETLGCTVEQTVATARSGFDYVFNSFKWWDLKAPWFVEHYRKTARVVPSVAFPASHDTPRLAEEVAHAGGAFGPGAEERLARRCYAASAAISAGVMMPVGYEFGFRKRLDVVKTTSADWEEASYDLSGFIERVNAAKAACPIMNVDSPPRIVVQESGVEGGAEAHMESDASRAVCLLRKHGEERLLIALNQDLGEAQRVRVNLGRLFGRGAEVRDLLEPGRTLPPRFWDDVLAPGEVRLIYARVPAA
jgi:starch synthase (maltosyl-transferring)